MYKNLFDKITTENNLRQKIEERIDAKMKTRKKPIMKIAVVAACITLIFSIAALAAYRYLSAEKVAEELGDQKLASYFGDSESIAFSHVETDGDDRAMLLGIRSGENISDFGGSQWDVVPERTYVALVVERIDGTEMTYDDNLMVSPFIQGLDPWQFNVFTMGGSRTSKIIDGALYVIVECDSIECFADRQLYLGIYNGMNPKDMYCMDKETGLISPDPDYKGMNILFDFSIDESKADTAKADEYVRRIREEMGWDEEPGISEEDLTADDFNFKRWTDGSEGEETLNLILTEK